MSTPYERGGPQDIFNKDPNVNPVTTEYNPVLKKYFPKEDGLSKCPRCEWVQSNQVKCEQCGTPNLKRINRKTPVYPPSKGVIAHFTRKVTMCWTGEEDPVTGLITSHPFDEKTRLVVNLEYQEAHKETYCGTCGRVYGWAEGRAATSQEMADCKAGKIAHKTVKPVMSEIESP